MFFFNDTATTEIYTLSLHDALPISLPNNRTGWVPPAALGGYGLVRTRLVVDLSELRATLYASGQDRKSTRLNSSHANISYAVFCLKTNNNVIYLSLFSHPYIPRITV